MKIHEILEIAKKTGKKFRRECCEDEYGYYDEDCNSFLLSDEKSLYFIPNDVLADDWELLPEKGKTFAEILPHLLAGEKIRMQTWQNHEYIFLADGRLIIENDRQPYTICVYDLKSNNWELYDEI